jgi:hypothetical protein
MRVDVPDAPRWRRECSGVEDFSGGLLSGRAPGNCEEHAPILPYPRLTSGQSLHLCALAHTGRVPFQVVPPIPVHRACRGRGKGGTRGGRLSAWESGRGEAHSLQCDSPSPAPARRFAAGACGRWAQHTQNGPPSVASRKYEPPVRCPARAPLGSPPPGHHPSSFNATRCPRLGKRRVVARCRWQAPDAAAPHTFGSCAYSGGGCLPDSRRTRRTRARQPPG